ncbi:MAG: lytic transglycosylase domain-containing protein [Rhodospirillales bacterium]|nr:lytic transglycosylase domain-containing protein [Rhodospirillales bacterium]
MEPQPTRRELLIASCGLAVLMLAPVEVMASRPQSVSRSQIMGLIAREARSLGVSPALGLAVAHAESNFDPRALSHKGARGLMQIMPLTAKSEYGIAADLLWDPRINTRLGLHFLRRLLVRYKGRVDLALSYYNGGSAVGDLPHARVIPATRNYVRKVQKFRASYSRTIGFGNEHSGYGIAGEQVSRRR